MPRIVRIEIVSSIAAGPSSTVLPDGTIVNPIPYDAADITFEDGTTIQVERPLSIQAIQVKIIAETRQPVVIDGIAEGANIP